MPDAAPAHSCGTLLGGKICYRQKVDGYRTGIEPVLLAACVPARPGDRVVEAGTGAGAGLLALSARVGGLSGLGIERDPEMAAIATENLAANDCRGLHVLAQDVTSWHADCAYDHAFANPPWHADAGTQSPSQSRRAAKMAAPGLLSRWTVALSRALRPRGTLSLVLPSALLAEGIAALVDADCREVMLVPFWTRSGEAARLVVLSGVRQGGGGSRLLPGLVLHRADGGYTEEAEFILRSGGGLPF